jgi:glyoxylase-like metal-dependent hydrolase (beta-lactamase superfamily II)
MINTASKRGVSVGLSLLTILTIATAQRTRSVGLDSLNRAHDVLQAGIDASGGLSALKALSNITRQMSGVRTDEGQGHKPVLPFTDDHPVVTNHPKITSIRDLRKQRVSDYLDDTILGGQPIQRRTVADGTQVFTIFYDYVDHAWTARPPAARTALLRQYPESLLQTACNRPETLQWIGQNDFEGRSQQAISFADTDGTRVSLYFDSQTHLLTKSETLRDDPVLGDVAVETVFNDYRKIGPLMVPFRYRDRVGGVMLQDLRASSIELNTSLDEALFERPEGFPQFELLPPVPSVRKLAEDVYAISGTYNSLFVVFDEYILVVEAGFNNQYSQAAIEQIKSVVPDKPIRYLVSTHFHFDHLGGVRSYIAQGATIITTPDAKEVINRIASTQHTIRADMLSLNPRSPIIETFETFTGNKRVFEDGRHTLELYNISPTPHCDEMIIAYLPRQKLLFEADLQDIEFPGRTGTGGEDTALLDKTIQALGIQVDEIIPVHGRPGTLEDLRHSVEKRGSAAHSQ